jgi:hypothetical protein
VGDEQHTAGPGTLVHAPRNLPHGYRVTKVPARWLIIFKPAGIEPLFDEVEIQAKYGAHPAKDWKRASLPDNHN